jgi:hypothetical protein
MQLTRLLLSIAMLSSVCAATYARPSQVPIPRPKPSLQSERSEQPSPSPEAKQSTTVQISTDDGMSQDDCKAAMEAAGATFNWIGEAELQGCTVEQGVELVSVRSNRLQIEFPQKPTMSCRFAKRFAEWTADIAAPVVVGHTGVQLQAVVTGPGLVCRNRVGTSTTKVSEHAKGNAIDIAGFALANKRSLTIGGALSESEARALTAMRTSACGYFTTVLGPGANPAHANHFHFDYGKHGRSYNYRICE